MNRFLFVCWGSLLEWSATGRSLHRHRHALYNLANHLLSLFRFFQRGSIKRTDDHAMCQNRNREGFEIFRSAVITAIKESHGLCGMVKHLRPTRRNTERKMIGLPGLADNRKRIGNKRFVHM